MIYACGSSCTSSLLFSLLFLDLCEFYNDPVNHEKIAMSAINPAYWDFKFIQDYIVVLENCKGVSSRMPIIGPVDFPKNNNKKKQKQKKLL